MPVGISKHPIGHNVYRCYPQAHESIVVAFHPKVFRVSLFIFSQRKAMVTSILNMDINNTHIHA
jgi:hypothetical protein